MAKKKAEKKKKPYQIWKNYKVEGDKVTRANNECPKCGQGFLLAKHGNRLTCGKCQYTEFISQPK